MVMEAVRQADPKAKIIELQDRASNNRA